MLRYLGMVMLLAFSHALSGADHSADEKIVVLLNQEQKLTPLYIAKSDPSGSVFADGYLDQLEAVLAFDFNHNGRSKVIPHTSECDQIAAASPLSSVVAVEQWQSQRVPYVLALSAAGGKVNIQLLSVNESRLKSFVGRTLTGDISIDRGQIHQLADAVHQTLFGVPGIAATHILYTVRSRVHKDAPWRSEIWECDYDGANQQQISHGENGYCISPIYLPPVAGNRSTGFFYVSYQNGQPKIYCAPLKGGRPQRLTSLRGNQLMPTVAHQRDKVAFISDVTGNPDLFMQEFSAANGPIGKPRQIFTSPRATQGSPSFSPDGSKVVFVSDKDGSARIYLINVPAAHAPLKAINAKLISKANRESSAPCWSPDGTKLAYCARNGAERQIWIYDFKTDKEWQLTQGPGDKENPSWAPDSLHLTFNSTGSEGGKLFIVNLNQPEAWQISSGPGEKRFPCWEPL